MKMSDDLRREEQWTAREYAAAKLRTEEAEAKWMAARSEELLAKVAYERAANAYTYAFAQEHAPVDSPDRPAAPQPEGWDEASVLDSAAYKAGRDAFAQGDGRAVPHNYSKHGLTKSWLNGWDYEAEVARIISEDAAESEDPGLREVRAYTSGRLDGYQQAIASLETGEPEPDPISCDEAVEEAAPEIPVGFVRWEGGECPVDQYAPVQIIYRDGTSTNYRWASYFTWTHDQGDGNIIAYRVIEPTAEAQSTDEAESPPPLTIGAQHDELREMGFEPVGNPEDDGPTKWRLRACEPDPESEAAAYAPVNEPEPPTDPDADTFARGLLAEAEAHQEPTLMEKLFGSKQREPA